MRLNLTLVGMIAVGIVNGGLGMIPALELFPVAPARAAEAKSPEQLAAESLNQQVQGLYDELSRTLSPNSYGVSLPEIESPRAVVNVIDRLEAVLRGASRQSFNRPESARSVVLRALEILYTGRGNTVPRDGKGWFVTNRSGATGVPEIEDILGRGLLDAEGKRRFEAFVSQHDFSNAAVKRNAGFPPQFDIGSDAIKNQVLSSLRYAPTGVDFQPLPKVAGKLSSVKELLDEAEQKGRISSSERGELTKWLGSVESNHYDKSVATANDPSAEFVNYFGRDDETAKVVDALTKTEKGHVLMTGKAGVGKTTVLKILSDRFAQGGLQIRDEKPPIILELPITSVTNPSDPSAIKNQVAAAKALSDATGRRVVLYVDEAHISTKMTRNALKGFLTEMQKATDGASKVNMVFSTTSQEAREFLEDTAFSRRWSEVNIPEFNREQTLALIKQAYVPQWKKAHQKSGLKFDSISDDAFDYAYRYAAFEQPHSGNPTGTKELLEAAIVRKMNREAGKNSGPFVLKPEDVQAYIQENLKMPLIPGDPDFDKKFEERWKAFGDEYVGNEGAKAEVKAMLRSHFGQMHKNKMSSTVAFGPPGGGKTFLSEQIAKHFFNGAKLVLNGGEYKNGGLELNKLIGSPSGTVGSEQQRSILTKFIKDNPQGGVIVIEEGDYVHQDVTQFFTNMITDKKFTDGLGKEWDASKFVLQVNSNIGQDRMIPPDATNRMNWEQFDIRRRELTEKALVEDGRTVERVRPQKLAEIFDQYVGTIVTKSNPGGDTSAVAQEAMKQRRRYRPMYILPPDRQELVQAAHVRVKNYIRDAKTDYGVTFDIPESVINGLLDIEHYEFEKGYSYVIDKLEDKLFKHLTGHLHERGKTVRVGLENTSVQVNGRNLPAQKLAVETVGGGKTEYQLGAIHEGVRNPWGDNPEMMKRLEGFVEGMGKHIKGNEAILEDMGQALKAKAVDWNAKTVFTLLGTSGNGKSETAKALAKTLFGDERALFKITGVDHPWDLSDYFRPPTGISGSNKETEFERWFNSRKNAGGGVLLFDELMSEIEKDSGAAVGGQKGGKIAVLQELYELLDEGKLKIAGRTEDARAFIPVITGNALQQLFSGLDDNPETDSLVRKILEKLTRSQIVGELEKSGLDAPKIARLGRIYVLGPQPKNVAHDVGKMKLEKAVAQVKTLYDRPLEIKIDERAVPTVVDRLSTVKLGMREVEEGFQTLILRPLNTIIADLAKTQGVPISQIEMKIPDGEKPVWLVNGREVALEGVPVGGSGAQKLSWKFKDSFAPGAVDRTPTIHQLKSVEKIKVTPEAVANAAVHEVYGHWMVNTMLNRRNETDFISTIQREGQEGYVRYRIPEEKGVNSLNSLLKLILQLEAGHRAPFVEGVFATGGGALRDQKGPPSDDLGKINRIFDGMVNNALIPGVTEQSSEEEKRFLKVLLEEVIDHTTDEVLNLGIQSGEFKPIFDEVVNKRYVNGERLDQFVSSIDFAKFGYQGDDALFLEKLAAGFAHVLKSRQERAKSLSGPAGERAMREYQRAKEIGNGILARSFREAEMRAKANPRALAEIGEIKSSLVTYMRNEGTSPPPRMALKARSCEELYDSLF